MTHDRYSINDGYYYLNVFTLFFKLYKINQNSVSPPSLLLPDSKITLLLPDLLQ